ncbi:hypothetical protein AB1N83_001822 [Pleurotus pulmonarius]
MRRIAAATVTHPPSAFPPPSTTSSPLLLRKLRAFESISLDAHRVQPGGASAWLLN